MNYYSTLHIFRAFRRVDEFSEYGDLDMMMQYVKDVQTVQRKLADCSDSITFINEVNHLNGHAKPTAANCYIVYNYVMFFSKSFSCSVLYCENIVCEMLFLCIFFNLTTGTT